MNPEVEYPASFANKGWSWGLVKVLAVFVVDAVGVVAGVVVTAVGVRLELDEDEDFGAVVVELAELFLLLLLPPLSLEAVIKCSS